MTGLIKRSADIIDALLDKPTAAEIQEAVDLLAELRSVKPYGWVTKKWGPGPGWMDPCEHWPDEFTKNQPSELEHYTRLNMANNEMINRVIEHISKEDTRFSMNSFIDNSELPFEVIEHSLSLVNATKEDISCGTVACIGGWAAVLGDEADLKTVGAEVDFTSTGAAVLGLSQDTANSLFYASATNRLQLERRGRVPANVVNYRNATGSWPLWFITSAEAIRCLEILRDEGVVDWDRAIFEVADASVEYNGPAVFTR